jgi:hypothetical protein
MAKKDRSKERTRRYRERLIEKQEEAADTADKEVLCERLNLCSFSEIRWNIPARTCAEEIMVHRQWLRALEADDVRDGETLRQLAKRTWNTLLKAEDIGVGTDGVVDGIVTGNWGVWYPLFSINQQHFQLPVGGKHTTEGGPLGEGIRGACAPEWFDQHWSAPDCTGDEPISVEDLPPLPPMPKEVIEYLADWEARNRAGQ